MKKIFVLLILALVISGIGNAESKEKPTTSLSGGETGLIYYESSNPRYFTDILDGTDNDGKVTVLVH